MKKYCLFLIFFLMSIPLFAQNWMQMGSTLEGNIHIGEYGQSVATNSDGSRIIIGAPGENTFRIYKWDTSTNDWVYEYGQTTSTTNFGYDVDMSDDGTKVVVSGNSRVYIYTYSGSWSQHGYEVAHTSNAARVAISGDGNYIAIRDPGWDDQSGDGSALVFYYHTNPEDPEDPYEDYWVQRGYSDISISGFYYDIDLNYNGSRLVVVSEDSAPSSTVRSYEWDGSNYSQLGADITKADGFGASVSTDFTGNHISIGQPGSNFSANGTIWVCTYSSSTWSEESIGTGEQNQGLGISVSINNDGDKVTAIGCGSYNSTGIIKTWANNGSSWSQVGQSISQPANYLLQSVSIAGDGGRIVLGAPGYNSFKGMAISYGPVADPTTQASNITFSNVQYNQMQLNWTKGNGFYRAVFMKEGSSGSLEVDNISYTDSSSYGDGSSINDGANLWYCVYDGTGDSVTVTNLVLGTTYRCQVFEYNGNLGDYKLYNNYTATGNPASETTVVNTPSISTASVSNITTTSAAMGGNISSNGGATVSERGVVYSLTSINSNPEIDGTGVTKNSNGDGTGIFSETISSLSSGTNYSVQSYATNSAGISYGGVETFQTSEVPLPITLASFIAEAKDGYIELNWKTVSETNNACFLIYRNSEVIKQIDGAGTTTESQFYSYVDATVVPGVTYTYVLADVDHANEENKYENNAVTVTIAYNNPEMDFIVGTAYPNPFNPMTVIPLKLANESAITADLYDLAGHEVKSLINKTLSGGNHTIHIDGSDLTNGIYMVKVSMGNTVKMRKIVLVK